MTVMKSDKCAINSQTGDWVSGGPIELDIAVLTRSEHCPPHVHVGTEKWDARFEFSFWHDGVRLWDVTPEQNEPKAAILEDFRQALKLPANLRRAREHWWYSRSTVRCSNPLGD